MTTEMRRPRARRRALGALAATAAIALIGAGAYAGGAPPDAAGAEGDLQAQALPGVAFKAPRIIVRGDVTTTGVPIPGSTPGTVVPGFGVFDGGGVGTVPTSLALRPNTGGASKKQLYVATQFGKVFVFDLDANHNATLASTITTINETPNHFFDGTTPKIKVGRQTTGIVFAPAAQQPTDGNAVLYVSHSDPDIFDEAQPGNSKVNPTSGIVSRLVVNPQGAVLQRLDIVTGLPRSGENHSINGMAFGPDGLLYLGVAGNTNGGGQSKPFAWFPEVPLGSSVVKINPNAILASPGGTIDVSVGARFKFTTGCGGGTVPANCTAAYTLSGSTANNGTKPGLLEIYATGFRNPYDMLWHTNGKLYLNENEGNPGIGPKPGSSPNNPSAPCGPLPAGQLGEVGFHADQLFQVKQGQYHGHPNPSRNECVHQGGVQPIANYFFAAASTGIAEFTPFVFGAALQGQLLTTNYGVTPGGGNGDTISRVKLSADGNSVLEIDNQFLTGFNDPLDVVVDTDGTLIVAEHGYKNGNFGKISVLEALGNFVCPAPGNPATVDSDGDGFKDADEIAFSPGGNMHCNPSSTPPDADGDKIPDPIDPDDDNDGIPDTSDRFQLDGTNGAGTALPFSQDFVGSANGGYFGSGLKGVQLSSKGGGAKPGKVSAGAAGGYLGVTATAGTAEGAANNQDNALQQGFKPTGPATVSAVVAQPFGGQPEPQGGELAGIFLGQDEDNFVRLSVHANGGTPVVEIGREQGGVFQRLATAPASLPQSSIRLFLDLDPGTDAVRARFQVGTGAVTDLGAAFSVPSAWLDTVAAGVTTTTAGSPKPEFGFIYDDFHIEAGTADRQAAGRRRPGPDDARHQGRQGPDVSRRPGPRGTPRRDDPPSAEPDAGHPAGLADGPAPPRGGREAAEGEAGRRRHLRRGDLGRPLRRGHPDRHRRDQRAGRLQPGARPARQGRQGQGEGQADRQAAADQPAHRAGRRPARHRDRGPAERRPDRRRPEAERDRHGPAGPGAADRLGPPGRQPAGRHPHPDGARQQRRRRQRQGEPQAARDQPQDRAGRAAAGQRAGRPPRDRPAPVRLQGAHHQRREPGPEPPLVTAHPGGPSARRAPSVPFREAMARKRQTRQP